MRDDNIAISAKPDELDELRCAYCGRRHPAARRDVEVRWCDGVLEPCPRWLIVEPELERVTA